MKIALILACSVVFSIALWTWRKGLITSEVYEVNTKPVEVAAVCPWREAEQDLFAWFPEATTYHSEALVLSGKRVELAERLQRPLSAEDMLLHTYVILRDNSKLGTVLTRRVKGDHGAIELVIALGVDGAIQHFKIQRIREPESITRALHNLQLEQYLSKGRVGEQLPSIPPNSPPEVRPTVENIFQSVQTALLLLELGTPHHNLSKHVETRPH